MEEVKYHQKFHQAKMSHLLSIFNRSRGVMLFFIVARLIFERNLYSAFGIFWGYLIMLACTNKLEKSLISNNKSVLLMAHFITITKILTSISATIRNNPTAPNGMQIGVVVWFVFTFSSMMMIEPDYAKASKFFCWYWSVYLLALWLYYQTILFEQIYMYAALFWMIHGIYKEYYSLSNSLTEIFYEFHNDPIVFYEGDKDIKVNKSFLSHFDFLVKTKLVKHHSQMLTEVDNPDEIMFTMMIDEVDEKISLLDVLKNKKAMEQVELSIMKNGIEKVFVFTFYLLENIYDSKTVWVFKDITHVHQLQKVKSQVEFRSVIMGCLTHELRTPINWVISILSTLQDYIEQSDEARKLLSVWQGTIEMLRSLTEDFIDFTRFENEKGLPIKKESIKIKEFFNEIKNIFDFQAEEKRIRFEVNASFNVPDYFYTDEKRLKQVILNLISNSFKFTQKGKIEIKLSAKKELDKTFGDQFTIENDTGPWRAIMRRLKTHTQHNFINCLYEYIPQNFTKRDHYQNYLYIEVADTGLGISEIDQKGLFTKFGTGKTSRGINTNGLGLGLYLSKEICIKLGGDIVWESIEGIGSTFIIKLPFDSKYEMKKFFKNDNVHAKLFQEFPASPTSNSDFQEFTNADTKDSFFGIIQKTYGVIVPKDGFNMRKDSSYQRNFSFTEHSLGNKLEISDKSFNQMSKF
jgi:signal transduction histidine kinase